MLLVLLSVLAASPLEEAQALEERGDDAAALQVLQEAVECDPKWALGRVELGRLQLKQGRTDAALQHLDVARSLAPENPRAHYFFALAADEQGHRNESRHALEVALTLRAGYSDAQVRLASVLFAEGDYGGAVSSLRPYVAAHPDATGARLQLADALERAGDRPAAEQELRALMQKPALRQLAGRRLVAVLEAGGRAAEAEKLKQQLDPPKRQLRELQPSRR